MLSTADAISLPPCGDFVSRKGWGGPRADSKVLYSRCRSCPIDVILVRLNWISLQAAASVRLVCRADDAHTVLVHSVVARYVQ